MNKLEPPQVHYASAAFGGLELGDLAEAKAELERIGPEFHNYPEVLEVRWAICAEEHKWEEALEIARALVQAAPDSPTSWLHQAYALRRVPEGGVKQAWTALLPAFDKFPKKHEAAMISYNLSCYACQMNQLDAARVWFKRAIVIGGKKRKDKIKQMALEDADLRPLWEEIKEF
jgi:tetratricopeptide (TPR) repeat protein